MSRHDELLQQGPREAPEPETAEQRTRRLRTRAVGGGVLGGGAAAAKLGAIGGLGKAIVWLFAWHSGVTVWRAFGWIGLLLLLGVVVAFFALRARSEQ